MIRKRPTVEHFRSLVEDGIWQAQRQPRLHRRMARVATAGLINYVTAEQGYGMPALMQAGVERPGKRWAIIAKCQSYKQHDGDNGMMGDMAIVSYADRPRELERVWGFHRGGIANVFMTSKVLRSSQMLEAAVAWAARDHAGDYNFHILSRLDEAEVELIADLQRQASGAACEAQAARLDSVVTALPRAAMREMAIEPAVETGGAQILQLRRRSF